MTHVVGQDDIERIVGRPRSRYEHWGRIVNVQVEVNVWRTRFFILHSQVCIGIHEDLRVCPFSKALDRMVADADVWQENVPTRLRLVNDRLVPAT